MHFVSSNRTVDDFYCFRDRDGARSSSPRRSAAGPIQVMLLDGESGGPYHAWQLTTPVLKKELEETGLFQVDVVTAPAALIG